MTAGNGDKRLRSLQILLDGNVCTVTGGEASNLSETSLKRPRIAVMGETNLASALVTELLRRGSGAFQTEASIGGTEHADLLVQLATDPSPMALAAPLAQARTLGAARILVLRQGLPLGESNNAGGLATEISIPVTTVYLPQIEVVRGSRGRSMARRALAALRPTATMSAVAGLVTQSADGVAPVSAALSPPDTTLHAFSMRLADILVGLAVLTIALPLLLGLALAIRRDSPGPAIFTQVRVGRQEKPFTLFKFRTMAVGTRQVGTHEVTGASVTRFGAKLRHYKLDELPQAWNLLVGNLTLVGPRPCLPIQQELVSERRRRGVNAVKPGLTGLAQVLGVDMSDPVRLAELDAAYVANRGVALDLALLARTFLGAGKGDRVSAAPSA